MSAVDRAMTDAELARIGEIVSHLPMFHDYDQDKLVKTAEACGEVLSSDGGLEQVLLPRGRCAAEAAARNRLCGGARGGRGRSRGQARGDPLSRNASEKLLLDRLIVAAIERGIRARNTVL